MNVLHIYRTCFPETKGGVEQVIRYICKGTQKLGVTSKILSLNDHEDKQYFHENTEIILCKKAIEVSSNSFSFSIFSKLQEVADWADIIHFHYPWPTGDLLSLCQNEKPQIVTYHSDIVKQRVLKILYTPLERLFLNHVDRIIATSHQYAKSSKNLRKYRDKTCVIPLAVDPSDYELPSTLNSKKWKKKLGGTPFFLFVGVLRYYKGLQFLLEAAKNTKLPIVIAGDGPQRQELEKYISEHNLKNVELLGYITDEDKISLLNLCKAFVFPSHVRSEAFGISLIEAQLFKKPIISCDIGTGANMVNIDGETGVVIEPSNSVALSEAMLYLSKNDELCEQFGLNAYKRAEQLFHVNTMSKQYYIEYLKLLS